MQKPHIIPTGLSSSLSPSGLVLASGGPGRRTPIMLRSALAEGRGNGAIPHIPASAGKGNRQGSSFSSASPSLAFASQPAPLLDTPEEPSRKEPSSSPGNGGPGCAGGPCERAAVLPWALGLSLQLGFLTVPPVSLGRPGSCCHPRGACLPSKPWAR